MSDELSTVPKYLDEDTGLHYIIGRHTVLFDNGVKILRKTFESRIANRQTVESLINEAKKNPDNCGWDFKHAIKTANLCKIKDHNKPAVAEKKIEHPRQTARPAPKITSSVSEATVPELKTVVESAPITPKTRTTSKIAASIDPTPSIYPSAAPQDYPLGVVGHLASNEALADKSTQPRSSKIKTFFSAPHTDVIIIILFVGILCVAMSMYHTDMFLVESGKNEVVALIAAVAMVTFSATAYTVARHVMQDHGIGFLLRLFFTTFLIVCGTATILFSVFSTINVSYEQFKMRQDTTTQTVVSNSSTVKLNNELLGDKNKQISDADSEVTRYEHEVDRSYVAMSVSIPTSDDPNDPTVKAAIRDKSMAVREHTKAQGQLEAARAKRDKLYLDKTVLSEKHEAAITSVIDSQSSAYAVVASKLGSNESDIKFIVYVIPAIFFDIVAPFAIAIVLLLKDRQNGIKKLSIVDRVIETIAKKLLGGS